MRLWSDRYSRSFDSAQDDNSKGESRAIAELRSCGRDARRCASSEGAWVLRYAQDDKTTRYAQDDQHYSFRSR